MVVEPRGGGGGRVVLRLKIINVNWNQFGTGVLIYESVLDGINIRAGEVLIILNLGVDEMLK